MVMILLLSKKIEAIPAIIEYLLIEVQKLLS